MENISLQQRLNSQYVGGSWLAATIIVDGKVVVQTKWDMKRNICLFIHKEIAMKWRRALYKPPLMQAIFSTTLRSQLSPSTSHHPN